MSKNPTKRPSTSTPQITVALLAFLGVAVTAVFGYLTVIKPQELSIEATQTAEARLAAVTVAATSKSESTPPFTPTPTLPVRAKISGPGDGDHVSTYPEVVTEYENIPTDRYLWVAVRIPKVRPTGLIYPQLKDGQLPPHLVGAGIYHTFAALGGEKDIGDPFNIVVLLADQAAHDQFIAYGKACSFNANACTGMQLPETGIEVLDFITVIRK